MAFGVDQFPDPPETREDYEREEEFMYGELPEEDLDDNGNEIPPDDDPLRDKPKGMSVADWMANGPDDYAKIEHKGEA